MPPTSTQLHGFKPPFVNNGERVLPVLTGRGEWVELRASPATWRRMALALAALETKPKPSGPRPGHGD